MDQPVYVIKSVESVWTYKYNGKIYDVLKKVVWILVILFIISSLFFHKNTFMELARMCFPYNECDNTWDGIRHRENTFSI